MNLPTNLGDWPIQLALVSVFMLFVYRMFQEFVSVLKSIAAGINAETAATRAQIAEMDKNSRAEREALLKIYIQMNQDLRAELSTKIDGLHNALSDGHDNHRDKKARN